MSTISIRQAPLVTKGSPQAHALSVAARVRALRAVAGRARRRMVAEYGRDADPMLTLLLDRLEGRLDDLEVTAEALLHHLMLHAPAPRDESEGAWVCANPACRRPLYGMKSTAESCSNVCRAAVSRLRAAGELPPREASVDDGSDPPS